MLAVKFKFPEMTMQAKALCKIEELKVIAREKGWELPEDRGQHFSVLFDLNSIITAGYAQWKFRTKEMIIQLHPKALEFYGDDYINSTVVHEFAHIIQYLNYPKSSAHGREFKIIMMVFGANGARCHNYDLASVTGKKSRRQTRVTYDCACRTHLITLTKHGKIQRGANYICRECKSRLVKV